MNNPIIHVTAPRHRKVWLLGTASVLAMCAIVPSLGWATDAVPETTNVTDTAAIGYTTLLALPEVDSATLSAMVTENVGGMVGAGTSAITTANSLIASAGGNDVSNTLSGTTLQLPNEALPTNDGIAVLGNSFNSNVQANARVGNNVLAQELSVSAIAATVSDNTMSANVTLNQSITTVQGQVPVNYFANNGSLAYNGAISTVVAGTYDVTGSVLATTAQYNNNSGETNGSNAMVTENQIGQTITGLNNTDSVLNGSPAVTGNSMTAGFIGNSATTGLSITAGGAPSFNGSTALTNVQANYTAVGDPPSDPASDGAAIVKYSQIGIVLDPGTGDASITLAGAAAVTGNTITASAVGNQAGNASLSLATGNILTLAGGIGLNGTSFNQNSETYFLGTDPHLDMTADALVSNSQNNSDTPLDSIVKQSFVTALVPIVDGGTVALSTNTITAQSIGNQAYNALLAPGLGAGTGAPLNGVLAIGSLQTNQNSPLTATIYQSGVPMEVGEALNSSVAATANTVTASATGNSVVNSINLNASNLASISGAGAGTFAERNPIVVGDSVTYTDDFGAYADVTVNSQQMNDALSPVTATNLNGGTSIFSEGGALGSTVSVTNNVAAALASGNAATNSLVLNGAAVQASAALLSAQSSYGIVTATVTDPFTGIVTVGAQNGTLALNGNLERAIATGNTASNALTVTGSSITVANDTSPASVFVYVPAAGFPIASDGFGDDQISAGFVAHNDQAVAAPVSAVLTFANGISNELPLTTMGIIAAEGLASSSADNSMNAVVAAARGNQANTQLTLSPTGTLSGIAEGSVYSPFAVVANAQVLTNLTGVAADIHSDAIPGGEGVAPLPPIFTGIEAGGLTASTITMGGNQIATLAQGNNATNGLTLTGAAIVAATVGTPLGLSVPTSLGDPVSLTADAAFVVHNMQSIGTDSDVIATQDGTGVQAAINGNLLGSTVMIGGASAPLGNQISSTATANLASNALTLGAAALSASGGLVNFQVSSSGASALMGEAGSLPTPASSNVVDAFTSNDDNGTPSGATFVDNITSYSYTGWLRSTDPNSVADGFTQGTGGNTGYYYKHVTSLTIPEGTVYGVEQTYTNTIPGTPGNWGSPGLVIALDGNVTNSVLGISQNMINAASTINSASNTVTSTSGISSSSIVFTPGPLSGPGALLGVPEGTDATVLADVGLLNTQAIGNTGSSIATSTATANGSFWISNTAVAPVYTNATLSISDNTQQASALGNTASNLLTLSPGVTPVDTNPVTASILSGQSAGGGTIAATSNMSITAPMALTGSSLTIAGNTNTANAVANDVTNALIVNGTAGLPGLNPTLLGGAESALGVPGVGAFGDYTVVNAQLATGGPVTSVASTSMLNNDLYLDQAAVSNSSITVDSNTTVAQAIANRASNTLTITAAGPSGATGSVANSQFNGVSVGATATIGTTFAIGQLPGTQLGSTSNNVTYTMTNNATQALATGNQASNVLNAAPTAYGTAVVGSGTHNSDDVAYTSATYTVLNTQSNGGAVTSAVTGVSPPLLSSTINTGQGGYVLALNSTGTGNVVNMSGNTVTSQAIGNRATNNIVLAALNTGTGSSAINSTQVNSAPVSASITNTQVGAAVSAGTVGRVANNQLVANAFGNIVANSIVSH